MRPNRRRGCACLTAGARSGSMGSRMTSMRKVVFGTGVLLLSSRSRDRQPERAVAASPIAVCRASLAAGRRGPGRFLTAAARLERRDLVVDLRPVVEVVLVLAGDREEELDAV